MALDVGKNFAKATLSTGYASGATSLVLTTGGGARFPAPPFNATYYDSGVYADPSDDPSVEIVRVTVVSTDTFTVTRAQEGTSAANHNTAGHTYTLVAGPTAKLLTDILGISITGSAATVTGAAQTAITSVGTLSGLTVTAAPTFSALTAGSIPFAGTAGLLSQDNANFFWDATNHRLGIGTTAPGEFLDVAGNITLNHFSVGATVDRRVGIGTTGGTVTGAIHWAGVQFAESSSNDQTLHFWTSADGGAATEKMMIDKSGSVGIGTTAPTSPLQVVTLPTYTSNATAAAGGLTAGAFFKVSVAGEYFVHVVV